MLDLMQVYLTIMNQLLQQEYGINFNLDLANQMEFGFGYENNVKVMFEEYNFKNFQITISMQPIHHLVISTLD